MHAEENYGNNGGAQTNKNIIVIMIGLEDSGVSERKRDCNYVQRKLMMKER